MKLLDAIDSYTQSRPFPKHGIYEPDTRFTEFGFPIPDFTFNPDLLDKTSHESRVAQRYLRIKGVKGNRLSAPVACPVPNQKRPGCYAWYEWSSFDVVRVGRALQLKQRLMDYWLDRNWGKTVLNLVEFSKWRDDLVSLDIGVSVWYCDNNEEFERRLIDIFNPRFNIHTR